MTLTQNENNTITLQLVRLELKVNYELWETVKQVLFIPHNPQRHTLKPQKPPIIFQKEEEA